MEENQSMFNAEDLKRGLIYMGGEYLERLFICDSICHAIPELKQSLGVLYFMAQTNKQGFSTYIQGVLNNHYATSEK